MDNKNLYLFQSFVGILIHSVIVDYNYNNGWASIEGLQVTGRLTLFYESFDLFSGWEGYWKRDKIMIVHHVMTFMANWMMLHFIENGDQSLIETTQAVMYWALLSNVTSIFNSMRILAYAILPYRIVYLVSRGIFALVFCILRSLQTIGMLVEIFMYLHNPYIGVIIFFWFIFTVMNVLWIHSIVINFSNKIREECSVRSERDERDERSECNAHKIKNT